MKNASYTDADRTSSSIDFETIFAKILFKNKEYEFISYESAPNDSYYHTMDVEYGIDSAVIINNKTYTFANRFQIRNWQTINCRTLRGNYTLEEAKKKKPEECDIFYKILEADIRPDYIIQGYYNESQRTIYSFGVVECLEYYEYVREHWDCIDLKKSDDGKLVAFFKYIDYNEIMNNFKWYRIYSFNKMKRSK